MATESSVQLPPDSTGTKIRLIKVQPDDDGINVYQEVIGLADDDGNIIVKGGRGEKTLPVTTDLGEKLDQLTRGIAYLLILLEQVARPRAPSPSIHIWVNEVLDHKKDD